MAEIQAPSRSQEREFLAWVQGLVRSLKESTKSKKNAGAVGANRAAASAAIDAFEDRAREIEMLDEQDPYFGRIDLEGLGAVYIGQARLFHRGSEVAPASHQDAVIDGQVVISAESPLVKQFYERHAPSDQRVERVREYDIRSGELHGIREWDWTKRNKSRRHTESEVTELLKEKPKVEGRLAAALAQPRAGELQPITATMTAIQYGIVDRPSDTWILLQGGPGTGKSVVALHRLSTIAFRKFSGQDQGDGEGLLFIAPRRSLLDYVKRLLPEKLGKAQVEQRVLADCYEFSAQPAPIAEETRQLKGDTLMIRFLDHAIWSRVQVRGDFNYSLDDIQVNIQARDLLGLMRDLRSESPTYEVFRREFRDRLLTDTYRLLMDASSDQLPANLRQEFQRNLNKRMNDDRDLKRQLSQMTPQLTPDSILESLRQNPNYFRSCLEHAILEHCRETGDISSWVVDETTETWFLAHQGLSKGSWDESDLPLLAHLSSQIGMSKIRRWHHIAVDEVQDLSPMAIRSLTYLVSAGGGATLIGDLAQATGTWYYSNWGEVGACAEIEDAEISELPFSFRLPADIMTYAESFRALAGVETSETTAVVEDVRGLHQINVPERDWGYAVANRIVEVLREFPDHLLGVIGSDDDLLDAQVQIEAQITDHSKLERIRYMSVDESKGIEFDTMFIIRPFRFLSDVIESDPELAARMMWVASSRATRNLFVFNLMGEPNLVASIREARPPVD